VTISRDSCVGHSIGIPASPVPVPVRTNRRAGRQRNRTEA
jgi:hypothetical protein